jgi:hypothetical protein
VDDQRLHHGGLAQAVLARLRSAVQRYNAHRVPRSGYFWRTTAIKYTHRVDQAVARARCRALPARDGIPAEGIVRKAVIAPRLGCRASATL